MWAIAGDVWAIAGDVWAIAGDVWAIAGDVRAIAGDVWAIAVFRWTCIFSRTSPERDLTANSVDWVLSIKMSLACFASLFDN